MEVASRAAARRFLHTLVSLGYVRSDGRLFALTPRVLELGFSYLSSLSLPEVLQPHLELLSREVGESDFADRCRAIADRGAKSLDAQLFNGEYYVQLPDPAHPKTVGS